MEWIEFLLYFALGVATAFGITKIFKWMMGWQAKRK